MSASWQHLLDKAMDSRQQAMLLSKNLAGGKRLERVTHQYLGDPPPVWQD